jgi:3,4-dihydroxy-2-butanone 4-phosphate synthase
MKSELDSIEVAIEAIRAGKCVIVVDDEDRKMKATL